MNNPRLVERVNEALEEGKSCPMQERAKIGDKVFIYCYVRSINCSHQYQEEGSHLVYCDWKNQQRLQDTKYIKKEE